VRAAVKVMQALAVERGPGGDIEKADREALRAIENPDEEIKDATARKRAEEDQALPYGPARFKSEIESMGD
jgi:hypothetical protein